MSTLFLLAETAAGYSVYEVLGLDELGQSTEKVQQSVTELARFGKVVKLLTFKPFGSAAGALEQVNAISENQLTDELKNVLELTLPKVNPRFATVLHSACRVSTFNVLLGSLCRSRRAAASPTGSSLVWQMQSLGPSSTSRRAFLASVTSSWESCCEGCGHMLRAS